MSAGAHLQLTSLLKLLHVALSFEGATSSKEDILVVSVDVLRPICQPGNGVVMLDSFPFSRNVRYGYGSIFANVEGNIFGSHSQLYEPHQLNAYNKGKVADLQGTFLGMLTTPTEEAWRFDSEISDLFLATVEETVCVLGFHLILGFLGCLFLLCGHRLLLCLLRLEVFKHRTEIAELEASYFGTISLIAQ